MPYKINLNKEWKNFLCGIIGYIGKKKALPILLEGLKALEYRGYDSSGVAFLKGKNVNIIKAVGPIVALEKKLNLDEDTFVGIGHTRWATHGVPNEVNSHPHTSGAVTLVHNGIIENYNELKSFLEVEGVKFKSETDSEVAAALINYFYEKSKNILEAIQKFKGKAKGSYAIGLIVSNDVNKIYVIKNMSPLIIGISEDGHYLASDVPAILNRTDKYITLLDGEYAEISFESLVLYDNEGKEKCIEIKTFQGDATCIDKGKFEHFMLKEINEEPDVVKTILTKYLVNDALKELPDLSKYRGVTIVACGSAMHAGLIGKYIIESHLNIPVTVEIASEFKYKKLLLNKEDVVIAISQSGETADTLAAVKIAKSVGCHTIGIVNVKESSIAREVDNVVYTLAGSEIAVATTKAYLAQVIILYLMGFRNEMNKTMSTSFLKIPNQISKLITSYDYEKIASYIEKNESVFFIGRLIDYALCMEGSLKLKEVSYIHSEAYAAGELKHGTISLITDGTPVFAILTDQNIADKTISNIKEVKVRGAKVILIVSESLDNVSKDVYDEKIVIPSIYKEIDSLLSVIPLQLIAYYCAKLRGCAIDKPRNLAKSVTVE